MDKVRMIALYVLFRDGVADEDRRRLYQHARLSLGEQEAVNNLVFLGVKVIRVGNELLRDMELTPSFRKQRIDPQRRESSRSSSLQRGSMSYLVISLSFRWS